MPRVRLKDVAEAVGVSTMTVSNAYNAPARLSADLRRRILDTAASMGYPGPGGAARTLRSGTSNSYGVVFNARLSYAFGDPYAVQLLTGFSQAMERRGASIVLLAAAARDGGAADALRHVSIDGLLSLSGLHPVLDVARERGIRVVSTDPTPDGDWVTIDDYAAGRAVGEHIRSLGHRRVAVAVEDVDEAATLRSLPSDAGDELIEQYRAAGYSYWCARLAGLVDGLGDARVALVLAGVNERESGRRAGAHVLGAAADRPTAVIAVSDVMALGVLDAVGDRGLVPGSDISVAGFDDIPDAARGDLTTVRQPILEKGRIAAELLLDPDRTPRRITLPHELVVRGSTGPAPQEAP